MLEPRLEWLLQGSGHPASRVHANIDGRHEVDSSEATENQASFVAWPPMAEFRKGGLQTSSVISSLEAAFLCFLPVFCIRLCRQRRIEQVVGGDSPPTVRHLRLGTVSTANSNSCKFCSDASRLHSDCRAGNLESSQVARDTFPSYQELPLGLRVIWFFPVELLQHQNNDLLQHRLDVTACLSIRRTSA